MILKYDFENNFNFSWFWALIYANLNLFVKSIITLSCGAAK